MSLKRRAFLSLALIASATTAYAQYLPDIGYMGGAPGSSAPPQRGKSAKAKKPELAKAQVVPVSVSIVGHYTGRMEGGKGEIDITGKAPNYQMSVLVLGPNGCVGGTDGPARLATPTSIVMTAEKNDDGGICKVTMSKTGDRWTVSENEACGYNHGAACSFVGTVAKAVKKAR